MTLPAELPSFVVHDLAARRTKYAVLIPVLNEGERIRRQLKRMADGPCDIVIVDGGSHDGSEDPVKARRDGVRALLIKTGPGRLSAQMRIGLAWCMEQGYDGVILIDGNDKDDPAAIPDFVRKLDEGWDHVQGSRFLPGGRAVNNPPVRLVGLRLVHAPLISLASRHWYTDTTNGFRAYSRRFLEDPRVQPYRAVFVGYELHYYLSIKAGRLGFRVCEIPVTREYPAGEPTPSKIKGLRGNTTVLATLFKACLGAYEPGTDTRGGGRS
jgi:glycosyltransferase involved in cell wall biosynthesis